VRVYACVSACLLVFLVNFFFYLRVCACVRMCMFMSSRVSRKVLQKKKNFGVHACDPDVTLPPNSKIACAQMDVALPPK